MRQLGAIFGLTFALALAFAQPAKADGVDRTYVLGDDVWTIVTDPTDGRVFVARGGAAPGVSVIDPVSGQVTHHATTGEPNYLALDSAHRRLYVSHFTGSLDVFDVTTMTIEATLPVGGAGVAVDPSTRRVYVAGPTDLWVIDGATNTVVASRPALPNESWAALAIDPFLHQVYVANIAELSDGASQLVYPSLVVLDDRNLSLVAEMRTDLFVRYALAVDELRHRVYLGDSYGFSQSTLLAFDGATLTQVGSVVVPGFAGGIAVGPEVLYVTAVNQGYHVLDADTFQVMQSLSTLPLRPLFPALHPDGRLYLSAPDWSGPDAVVAISMANHAPVITAASLGPGAPVTSDILSFAVVATDGDFADLASGQGDPLTLTYEWARNGIPLPGETASTLDLSRAGAGERGDTITARVSVTDPEGLSTSTSASVLIANALPAVTLSLSSTAPGTNDVLTATTSASDADGDVVALAYEWSRNGVVIPGAATGSLDLATQGDEGDVIVVRVTASDGHGGLQAVTARAFVVPASGSFFYMKSQPGDYIGGGAEELYTATSSFIDGSLPQGGSTFNARVVQGNYVDWWYVTIAAPIGQPLAVGSYTGAVRAAFRPAGAPGLDINGNGRGCNTLTGKFDVTALAFSSYGEVSLFDATFEQHCEGGSTALIGRVRLEIPPPTPGVTLPPGSMTVPTSGTFLYMNQPIPTGGSYEQLYTSADSAFNTSFTQGDNLFYASVIQGNYVHWWYVNIAAQLGRPLTVGSYVHAVRATSRTAVSPGLDVYGDGMGCNEIKGKFDVDEMSFAPTGELLVFQATFEQWCDASFTARYGRIRIENAPPPPPPVTLAVSLGEEGMASNKSGAATISGTVSCSRNVPVNVSGTLSEPISKRTTVTGTFSLTVACSSPSVAWSTTVVGDNGKFGAGQASATVSATACEQPCVTATATRSVKLNAAK
jgi:hypothetical protein